MKKLSGRMMKNIPGKHLPALMDGKTMLLPAAVLPLPRKGTNKLPGGLKEREWFDIVSEILIPRWAVECIRDNLVFGQGLKKGESLKERVETILQTPGERDKWERIVGWGRRSVRALNVETAEKWSGSWSELVEIDKGKRIPFMAHLGFSRRYAAYLGVAYWASWAEDALHIVETWSLNGYVLNGTYRGRAARLLAEAETFCGKYTIPSQTTDPGIWCDGYRVRTQAIDDMYLCLSELLLPSAERKLSGEIIRMIFEANMAYCLAVEARTIDGVMHDTQVRAIRAQMETKLAEAEADKFKAQGKAEAEAEARQRAEERWRDEVEAKATYKALAEERGKKIQMLEEKIYPHLKGVPAMVAAAQEALEDPVRKAKEFRELLRNELTPKAQNLYFAWEESEHSLNAAAKKSKIPETTARRIFDREIVPFFSRHSCPLPEDCKRGKRKTVRMKGGQLDAELYKGAADPNAPPIKL